MLETLIFWNPRNISQVLTFFSFYDPIRARSRSCSWALNIELICLLKAEVPNWEWFNTPAPGDNVWRHFACKERGFYWRLWVETRDTATCPFKMPWTAPTAKDYLAPNVSSAKDEKPKARGRLVFHLLKLWVFIGKGPLHWRLDLPAFQERDLCESRPTCSSAQP